MWVGETWKNFSEHVLHCKESAIHKCAVPAQSSDSLMLEDSLTQIIGENLRKGALLPGFTSPEAVDEQTTRALRMPAGPHISPRNLSTPSKQNALIWRDQFFTL